MAIFGRFGWFFIGFYAGAYVDQRFTVLPRLDDPQEIWDKLQKLAKEYEKDSDNGNIKSPRDDRGP